MNKRQSSMVFQFVTAFLVALLRSLSALIGISMSDKELIWGEVNE